MRYWIWNFQNALGAMIPPTYATESMRLHDADNEHNPNALRAWSPFNRIELIWVLWILFNIQNVVVLINFLITYISEAYEEVMSRDKIDEFFNKAELNHLSALHLKPFSFMKYVTP